MKRTNNNRANELSASHELNFILPSLQHRLQGYNPAQEWNL